LISSRIRRALFGPENAMTITLNFPPEAERELYERAAANGQTVEGFIRDLVEREVVATGGNPTAPVPRRSEPLDQILEPVRREFEDSEMSEAELTQFLREVRDEVRQEKRARKVP
jgi:hypothetical protein